MSRYGTFRALFSLKTKTGRSSVLIKHVKQREYSGIRVEQLGDIDLRITLSLSIKLRLMCTSTWIRGNSVARQLGVLHSDGRRKRYTDFATSSV